MIRASVQQGLLIALGIVLAAVMVALGIWQLDVYHRQGAAAAARRAEAPPIPLSSVARPGTAATEGFGRSVSFEGTYDPALQLLVPAEDGTGGFRVLTGLRLADGSVVAVVRGVGSGPTAPPPPIGEVQQVGVLLPTEEYLASADPPSGQIASVRLPALAQQWPGPLIDGFVTLSRADSASQGLAPADAAAPRVRRSDSQWGVRRAVVAVRGIRLVDGSPDGARHRRTGGRRLAEDVTTRDQTGRRGPT